MQVLGSLHPDVARSFADCSDPKSGLDEHHEVVSGQFLGSVGYVSA